MEEREINFTNKRRLINILINIIDKGGTAKTCREKSEKKTDMAL